MIEYIEIDESGIDQIKVLWEKLNESNKNKTKYFLQRFLNYSFEQRKAKILEQANFSKMRIELAKDSEKNSTVAYCVSSADSKENGQILSIFVEEGYRTLGIGGNLMKHALGWMDEIGVMSKRIDIVYGDEEAVPFCEKFGFYPQRLVLKQITK